jgi:hypothetical protein
MKPYEKIIQIILVLDIPHEVLRKQVGNSLVCKTLLRFIFFSSEYMINSKICRLQRNFWLAGFALLDVIVNQMYSC